MEVLIVDDEKDMLKILKTYFQKEGYQVKTAQNGQEALDIFFDGEYKLVLLDWMMPKVNGIDVCKVIKERSSAKVLLITAKNTNDDELKALTYGADDFISKPFDPRILMLRAKKLLNEEKCLTCADIIVNLNSQKVYKNNVDVHATRIEFDLVRVLIQAKGHILTRERLLDLVWGFDYYGDIRTVDTHIRRLRKKIGEAFIKTYRGIGYSLEDTIEKDS